MLSAPAEGWRKGTKGGGEKMMMIWGCFSMLGRVSILELGSIFLSFAFPWYVASLVELWTCKDDSRLEAI